MTWNDDQGEFRTDGDADAGPDEADRSDQPAEVPCPWCKRQIQEEAPRCPYCGCYISAEDTPHRRPWWWIIAVIVLVLLLLRYVLRW